MLNNAKFCQPVTKRDAASSWTYPQHSNSPVSPRGRKGSGSEQAWIDWRDRVCVKLKKRAHCSAHISHLSGNWSSRLICCQLIAANSSTRNTFCKNGIGVHWQIPFINAVIGESCILLSSWCSAATQRHLTLWPGVVLLLSSSSPNSLAASSSLVRALSTPCPGLFCLCALSALSSPPCPGLIPCFGHAAFLHRLVLRL